MLDVSNLINVTVALTTAPASGRTFNTTLIAGDSAVISGAQRIRQYTALTGVASDFGVSAPEYLAASLYFGQSPQPSTLYIGRWIRTATSAQNVGGILSSTQQTLSNFNAISNGSFTITIDGTSQNLTGISLLSATNLNGVAAAINAVLTNAIATWNGTQFVITSNSTGIGVKATGSITMTGTGTASDTVTVGGTVITFVASGPTGNQVLIGGSAAATAGNLWTFLNSSTDTNISKCTYSLNGAVVTATYASVGTAGNSFTLAKSSTAITLSAATLLTGANASAVGFATTYASGTDISALLQLTSTLSSGLITGYAAETPLACVNALATTGTYQNSWYGLGWACATFPADSDYVAVAGFIESQTITRLQGISTQETSCLNSTVSTDIGSLILAGSYAHSFVVYCSTNLYAAVSVLGRACGVNFAANNSTINLMYKQMPGIIAEDLTTAQAAALQAKNINSFVKYDNNTSLIQWGTVGVVNAYIDQTQGVDWFQNDVQTKCFNVLYTTTTKVPQTDAGANQLINACNQACNDAINNGLAAPGTWNGPSFGNIVTGQYLKNGFYVYMPSVNTQSQATRVNRAAPPIQIALKLAGAFNSVSVLITVNQ